MTPPKRHGLWATGELWVIPPVPTPDGPKSMGYRKLWVIRRYGLWGIRLYRSRKMPAGACPDASSYSYVSSLPSAGSTYGFEATVNTRTVSCSCTYARMPVRAKVCIRDHERRLSASSLSRDRTLEPRRQQLQAVVSVRLRILPALSTEPYFHASAPYIYEHNAQCPCAALAIDSEHSPCHITIWIRRPGPGTWMGCVADGMP